MSAAAPVAGDCASAANDKTDEQMLTTRQRASNVFRSMWAPAGWTSTM